MDNEAWITGDERMPVRAAPLRGWVLIFLFVVMMGAIISRSFYLQIVKGGSFLTMAEQNRVTALPIPAPRGVIYDRTGKALVENVASTDLVVDPSTLPPEEHEAYLVDRLPQIVHDVSPEMVREAVARARATQQPVVLKKALAHDEVLALQEAQEDVFGVRLLSALVRKYLFGASLAHVVGHTGPVTAEELGGGSKLLPIDTVGKIGLEKEYDEQLRGQPGHAYLEVNASGRPQKDLGRQEPVPGEDLRLTIDAELQQYITELLTDKAGAVVVLDPRDGAVLALVSAPTFDPNNVAAEIAAPGEPLFHRAIRGAYPPGSTIKPFLAAAALQEGVIAEDTKIMSTGGISVGVWHFPDWKSGGHGLTDVKKAISESVNTFFYVVAGGDESHRGLGVEKVSEYLHAFDWGQLTGIDLPNEGEGFLPTKQWKQETKGEPWYIGDTYHLGIGQGDVLVTPLQLAAATGAVANGSMVLQPHVRQDASSKRTRVPIEPRHMTVVRDGMRATVTEGSGRRLAIFPLALAGKTGTAQVGGERPTHAWFTSFGPFEAPELVVTVLLEHAGEGDDAAVPFAEMIWKWWFTHRRGGDLSAIYDKV